jgi:hypothetical protein
MTQNDADFKNFCKVWLSDVREGNPSTVELGRRFARKLISQWLDVDEFSDEIVYCDGNGDGGIDIAYLHRGETTDESYQDGDTWYLVQSKYGKSFSGTKTLLQEAQKLFETLEGKRKNLSSLTQDLLERLHIFLSKQSEDNRLVFVFATDKPLNAKERYALSDIRAMGKDRFGERFDVDAVSIATIYQRTLENRTDEHLEISLKGNFVKSGENLLVGSVTLGDLYDFLKGYHIRTGDLDQLYEKNIRLFLGMRGKVNKSIKETLDNNPEEFGFYNNGVTIVVQSVEKRPYERFNLINPSVVNGCQTTRTIYNVLFNKFEAGGKGSSPLLEEWKERFEKGVVIVKIVKVGDGSQGESLLQNITRYTNSQNAVREKDFLVLASGFRLWQRRMGKNYHVFLEIQRGSWDAHKASQKNDKKLTDFANIYDLLKVYGAGWLGEAGLALSGNSKPFVQGGSVYEKIVNKSDIVNNSDSKHFGVDDLYAAYLLQKSLKKYNFGRGKNCRKITTRFLFFMVVIELLKEVMLGAKIKQTNANITQSLLKLFKEDNESVCHDFFETAVQFIDKYTKQPETEEKQDSVFNEPDFSEGTNLVTYLKNTKFGKNKEYSPKFCSLLETYKHVITLTGKPSLFDMVLETIKN